MRNDPAREAEFNEANYSRVEADVRKALRRSGCIYPDGVIEALTCTVLEESLQTRRRMSFMLEAFTDAFGAAVDVNKLRRLEVVFLAHLRDENNLGYLPEPE